MSSPENSYDEKDQWDRILSRQLQQWIDEHPTPKTGRTKLLQEAAKKEPARPRSSPERSLPRMLYRRVARFFPKREQVPFSMEDFVHSVTISSPQVAGVIYCA